MENDNAAYEEIAVECSKDNINMTKSVCYGIQKKIATNVKGGATAKISSSYKCAIILGVTVAVVVALGLVTACAGFAVEISRLKRSISATLGYSTEQEATHNQVISLNRALSMLSDRLDNITVEVALFPAPSCAALPPSSPSGYYWIRVSNGSAVRVYCDMTRLCGNITGGWMRVAHLDMTNASHQCPRPLREHNQLNTRTCVRNVFSRGCSSLIFSAYNAYRSVCGKIIAYQSGTPDAFDRVYHHTTDIIDFVYVDGVSLTHGSPREHIWTFAAARDFSSTSLLSVICPCIRPGLVTRTNANIPAFVEDHYFCDTGSHTSSQTNVFYSTDPLWDGAGCVAGSTCCSFNTPPWFFRQLAQSTSDDIEMRLCRTADSDNENIYIETIDIFVQ